MLARAGERKKSQLRHRARSSWPPLHMEGERAAILESPLVASDEDWYTPAVVIDAKVTESTQEWQEILDTHLRSGSQDQQHIKKLLASTGVPPGMRPQVWLTFSGAADRMAANPNLYQELCNKVDEFHATSQSSSSSRCGESASKKSIVADVDTSIGAGDRRAQGHAAGARNRFTSSEGGESSGSSGSSGDLSGSSSTRGATTPDTEVHARRVLEQVEKDLRRTEVGSDGDKLQQMRRVLCAYASYNPSVGYVQGMNFIAVALLRLFDEPQTFWMLALIVEHWLPDHFSHAMVGNHVDCRVLATLTSEHLPKLSVRLAELDISIQLLTTRWFLCLWSSVLPVRALHRLWDYLFVMGPAGTMQAAMACMHVCEIPTMGSTDIGDALTRVKEVLRLSGDGAQLMHAVLYRVTPISEQQLTAWRQHTRQLVLREQRHMHSMRRLHKLVRQSGFSMHELKLIARVCGPYTMVPADAASSLLRLSIDYEGFVRVLAGLVPQWKNDGGAGSLVHRLFDIFLQELPDASQDADLELDRGGIGCINRRMEEEGLHEVYQEADAMGSPASDPTFRRDGEAAQSSSLPTASGANADERSACRLSFEQLVRGLGWLLRGTSGKRADLCFRCFAIPEDSDGSSGASNAGDDRIGSGGSRAVAGGCASYSGVHRPGFCALLASVYIMYESGAPLAMREGAGRLVSTPLLVGKSISARVREEASQFVGMMYELYDEANTGRLDQTAFNRAAHQHPLLVQAFQLEQLDLPDDAAASSSGAAESHNANADGEHFGDGPCSPMTAASHLRVRNGIYLGLRPGAISVLDDDYFGRDVNRSLHSVSNV